VRSGGCGWAQWRSGVWGCGGGFGEAWMGSGGGVRAVGGRCAGGGLSGPVAGEGVSGWGGFTPIWRVSPWALGIGVRPGSGFGRACHRFALWVGLGRRPRVACCVVGEFGPGAARLGRVVAGGTWHGLRGGRVGAGARSARVASWPSWGRLASRWPTPGRLWPGDVACVRSGLPWEWRGSGVVFFGWWLWVGVALPVVVRLRAVE